LTAAEFHCFRAGAKRPRELFMASLAAYIKDLPLRNPLQPVP
jgi:hypothetical protein